MWRTVGLVLALSFTSTASFAKPYRPPKTPWGAPDLGGIWTSASYTRLERPGQFKTLVVPPDAAGAYEAKLKTSQGVPKPPPGADAVGQFDSEFFEAGDSLTRIGGQARSSWIVDPPDGRLPYRPEARRRLHIGLPDPPEALDDPEARPAFERCMTSTGSAPPLLAGNDANLYEFVQTPDYVVIEPEKNHEIRIIPLNAAPDPKPLPSSSGNSVSHWEGDTLVVETTGFRDAVIDRGPYLYQSGRARITERFTRISKRGILYQFQVADAEVFTQTWRGETVFKAAKGPLYEYACHEGNRSIVNILAAARRADGSGKSTGG